MEPATYTPHRPIRISDELWDAFGALVGGRNRARVVREFVAWYCRVPGAKLPQRPPEKP
jgi:hypothetical protein